RGRRGRGADRLRVAGGARRAAALLAGAAPAAGLGALERRRVGGGRAARPAAEQAASRAGPVRGAGGRAGRGAGGGRRRVRARFGRAAARAQPDSRGAQLGHRARGLAPGALRGAPGRRGARLALPARRRDHARGAARAPARDPRPGAQDAAELEDIYGRIAARRHDPRGHPEIRLRLARRRTIDVDLHMHTDHSPDCATPVATLLDTARARGLGAIAITDHNEISGALEASELAAGKGLKVIVGEEVKTAEQGEVIGLFLTERIERGMTIEETIAEIRRQGGLVYVPHPF